MFEHFRFTTAGESHGKGLVVIVEGVPAGLPLSAADVAAELAAEDATFKQVWDSFTTYRAGYKVWKELGYLN